MNKNQKVVTAVSIALVPLLMLLAFNALVLQPQLAEVNAEARGLGTIRFSNPVVMNQTLDVDGAVNVDGALVVDGDTTLGGDLQTTGYFTAASVYPTFSSAAYITADTSLLASGTLDVVGATTFGGGFGATGCSVSAAGVLQCDGAATVGGAATITGATTLIDALTVGGGYGATGCTLSAAGVLQCNGAATVDGATTSTGLLNANAGIAVDSTAFTVADTSGNVSTAGTLGVSGVATFGASNIYSSQTITPTDGGTITPTAELVTLAPGGAVGVSMAACTSGQVTVLYNSLNASVVITDTGNGTLAGDQTLGQYDTLPLVCIGAKWIQTGPVSAN